MKLKLPITIIVFFIVFLSSFNLLAQTNNDANLKWNAIAIDPPVTSPVYLCQSSDDREGLTAIASAGNTLIWYGTNATGGIGSPIAPIPSLLNVGSTTYYVSQTDGVIESPRASIVVTVVAGSNKFIFMGYDDSRVTTGPNAVPPTILSSVFFVWSTDLPDPVIYNYSYQIVTLSDYGNGPIFTGSTNNPYLEVFGILKNQSVYLTVSIATNDCVLYDGTVAVLPCRYYNLDITPDFPEIAPICQGATFVPALDDTSPNGLTGTWTPAVINTTNLGSSIYKFVPDPIAFPCAKTQYLNVRIVPKIIPVFNSIPATVCQGATAPILPLISNNTVPISGIWSPATIDTSILGPTVYTFTPDDASQCDSAILATITVSSSIFPNFAPIPDLCSGSSVPVLSKISPDGITGTWSPSVISNTVSGDYVFTPNPNQCAVSQTLNVVITPKIIPKFSTIPAFCSGTIAPLLPATSLEGISGTWSPAIISNSASGSYTFTPNATECATDRTLNVVVNSPLIPDFSNMDICSGATVPILATTSPNGVTGTWSPSTIDNTMNGTYVFTPDGLQCAVPKTINVIVKPSNTLDNISWTVTDAFTKNHIITIATTGTGNYLYQLDYGPFQTSPVFENVASGLHSITVKEVAGCGTSITENNILVIGYPKFFTPNGDNYNDTWNIFALKDQPNARIHIFDRYGKLLKDISPKGSGWDGTFAGNQMPAADYWFTVEYEEQGITKKFKSHFALKR